MITEPSSKDEEALFGDMEPIPNDNPEEYAANAAAVQRNLDDFAAGRHRPASKAFKRIEARSRLSVPGVDTGLTT